jgi:hypothetical protein
MACPRATEFGQRAIPEGAVISVDKQWAALRIGDDQVRIDPAQQPIGEDALDVDELLHCVCVVAGILSCSSSLGIPGLDQFAE